MIVGTVSVDYTNTSDMVQIPGNTSMPTRSLVCKTSESCECKLEYDDFGVRRETREVCSAPHGKVVVPSFFPHAVGEAVVMVEMGEQGQVVSIHD